MQGSTFYTLVNLSRMQALYSENSHQSSPVVPECGPKSTKLRWMWGGRCSHDRHLKKYLVNTLKITARSIGKQHTRSPLQAPCALQDPSNIARTLAEAIQSSSILSRGTILHRAGSGTRSRARQECCHIAFVIRVDKSRLERATRTRRREAPFRDV